MRSFRSLFLATCMLTGLGFGASALAGETAPSVNESPGCGALDGVRGPYATTGGRLANSEPIWGPWGDLYGRDIGEVRSRLVHVHLPMTTSHTHIYIHERAVPAFNDVVETLQAEIAAGRWYSINANYTWSFNPSAIPPSRHLSFHAVGASIDINSHANPFREDDVLITDMPQWFVDAWVNAGWCWGGTWQEVKDPMHFSWQGWGWTDSQVDPGPTPPATQRAFFPSEVAIDSMLAEVTRPGAEVMIGDINRDGALDIARVREWSEVGHLRMETATSHHDYETCVISEIVVDHPRGTLFRFADVAGLPGQPPRADGRPDLVVLRNEGGSVAIETYPTTGNLRRRTLDALSPAPWTDGGRYAFSDLDRDGTDDLVAVTPEGAVTVVLGPAFDTVWNTASIGTLSGGTQIALSDRTNDGIPDLLTLRPDGLLTVRSGSASFAMTEQLATSLRPAEGERFLAGDWDGDGHIDLWLVGLDGDARVFLGGARSASADLRYWFVDYIEHWTPGAGCQPDPRFDTARFPDAYAAVHGSTITFAAADAVGGSRFVGALDEVLHDTATARPVVDVERDGGRTVVLVHAPGTQIIARTHDATSGDQIDLAAFGQVGIATDLEMDSGSPAVSINYLASGHSRIKSATPTGTESVMFHHLLIRDFAVRSDDALAALGSTGRGPRIHVRARDGSLIVMRGFARDDRPVALHSLPNSDLLVVIERHGVYRWLIVNDRLQPVASGGLGPALHLVSGTDGRLLVAAKRNVNGAVRIEAVDLSTGSTRWVRNSDLAYTPSHITFTGRRPVITGHSFGDSTVMVDIRDPDTGAVRARYREDPLPTLNDPEPRRNVSGRSGHELLSPSSSENGQVSMFSTYGANN